jgi:hypothetical protein
MSKKGSFKDRVGEIHLTNEGYEVEIVECFSAKNLTIRFDTGVLLKNRCYRDIAIGAIKNPLHPSVYGVGYYGIGEYDYNARSKNLKGYKTWSGLLERVFSKLYIEKQPTYKDVTVCEEWKNFNKFMRWFENNYNPETMQGWQLDKDILVKGNKVYSPETCGFVPQEINALFTKRQNDRGDLPIGVQREGNSFKASFTRGSKRVYLGLFSTKEEAFQVYKVAKEGWIKEVAEKWKPFIALNIYRTMINYKVEITD